MRYPIFIPSKGRSEHNASTLELCRKEKIRPTVFVEPLELHEYASAFPFCSFVDIGENDKGIVYVRQFMLDYARRNSIKRYWSIDDDMVRFYIKNGSKVQKCSVGEALESVEDKVEYSPFKKKIGLAGMQYSAMVTAFSKIRMSYIRHLSQVVLINSKTKIDYDDQFLLNEDLDFSVMHLFKKWYTMLDCEVGFEAKKMGKTVGGLFSVYKATVKKDMAKRFYKKHLRHNRFMKPPHTSGEFVDPMVDFSRIRKDLFRM